MSADLIGRSPDLRRLDEAGFELEIGGGYLLVHNVPYVTPQATLARGTLICALALEGGGQVTAPPGDHTMFFAGQVPCHRDGSPLTVIINSSARQDLGHGIVVDHYLSSKPEGTGRYESFYEKVVAYESHIAGAARSLDRTANARTGNKISATGEGYPFQYPDTASSRYGVGAVSQKLAFNKVVAIIGLGGTGAYVLDLVAKTAVREIHLFDGDQFLSHNAFRAPGAPDSASLRGFPMKVDYYTDIYSRMHKGISPHPVPIEADNADELDRFDFAFVGVDKGSSRRTIAQGLHGRAVPFIDMGIGVGMEGDQLDGCARVSLITPEMDWGLIEKILPFGDEDEDEELYRANIQIADLNALNATMAVLRWKRWASFYRDGRHETNSVYMVEGNLVTNRAY